LTTETAPRKQEEAQQQTAWSQRTFTKQILHHINTWLGFRPLGALFGKAKKNTDRHIMACVNMMHASSSNCPARSLRDCVNHVVCHARQALALLANHANQTLTLSTDLISISNCSIASNAPHSSCPLDFLAILLRSGRICFDRRGHNNQLGSGRNNELVVVNADLDEEAVEVDKANGLNETDEANAADRTNFANEANKVSLANKAH
jgi:hypothetical protein